MTVNYLENRQMKESSDRTENQLKIDIYNEEFDPGSG